MDTLIAPTLAIALFTFIFLFPSNWRVISERSKNYRRVASFASGMSVAYIFVHLLPELGEATETFAEMNEELDRSFQSYFVYYLSLLGFIIFYGLANLTNWSKIITEVEEVKISPSKVPFLVHFSALSAYVFFVCYSIHHLPDDSSTAVVLYTVAMGAHFLSLKRGLEHEYGEVYPRSGKYFLASSCVVGWLAIVVSDLPEIVVVSLLGFISGSIIMITMTTELPKEKEGRFFAFLLGGVLYSGILALL